MEGKNNKYNNVDLVIKHNLYGRRPCWFSVKFLNDALCVFTFPSHCLLISFHNYLIMSLTDAVNKSAENAIRIIKKVQKKKKKRGLKWGRLQMGLKAPSNQACFTSHLISVLHPFFFFFNLLVRFFFFFLPFTSNNDRTQENKRRTHMEHYH